MHKLRCLGSLEHFDIQFLNEVWTRLEQQDVELVQVLVSTFHKHNFKEGDSVIYKRHSGSNLCDVSKILHLHQTVSCLQAPWSEPEIKISKTTTYCKHFCLALESDLQGERVVHRQLAHATNQKNCN